MKRVLYIHHSRNFEPSENYLNNDIKTANKYLYGAQELDTWGGVRFFSNLGYEVYRLEISTNLKEARLLDHQGFEIKRISYSRSIKNKTNFRFIWRKLKYLDGSFLQFIHPNLINFVEFCLFSNSIDILWSDTQFYVAILPSFKNTFVRSVNFEPLHVLSETEGLLRWLRMLLKIQSEWRVSRNHNIASISPRDKELYDFFSIEKSSLIPLRQLSFILDLQIKPIIQKNTFIFTGSTFDVLHNRRNLMFVVEEIAPLLHSLDSEIKIQIFGNRIPSNLSLPSNVEYMGFDGELRERILGSTGVIVPFNGGAGMQSKVFEPLTLGSPVILNPKNLAGFKFREYFDFLPANSTLEYVKQMVRLKNDEALRTKLSINSRKTSEFFFSHKAMFDYHRTFLANINIVDLF